MWVAAAAILVLMAHGQLPSLAEWEDGLDGMPLRTEYGMQAALSSIGLHRNPADSFGSNNCLADSLILSLRHAGFVRPDISYDERRAACSAARWHLVQEYGLSSDGNPYLAHDSHAAPIFDFLRRHCPRVWLDVQRVRTADLTIIVFDRFNGRLVTDSFGRTDELAPTEPVRVPPLAGVCRSHAPLHVQVQLYSYTFRDGTGWHYEWLSSCARSDELVAPSAPEPETEPTT